MAKEHEEDEEAVRKGQGGPGALPRLKLVTGLATRLDLSNKKPSSISGKMKPL